jgi:hypothetical protein
MTRVDGATALILAVSSLPLIPAISASRIASGGRSWSNKAQASSPDDATRGSISRRRNPGAPRWRSSSLLFDTRTGGILPRVSRSAWFPRRSSRGAGRRGGQATARMIAMIATRPTTTPPRTAQPRMSDAAVVGRALGGEVIDLAGAGADRRAQSIDPLVQLGELRPVDPVEVDERPEGDHATDWISAVGQFSCSRCLRPSSASSSARRWRWPSRASARARLASVELGADGGLELGLGRRTSGRSTAASLRS